MSCVPELHLSPGSTLTILLSLAISGPALLRKVRGENVDSELDLEAGVLDTMAGNGINDGEVWALISYHLC